LQPALDLLTDLGVQQAEEINVDQIRARLAALAEEHREPTR
jgi:hypothetical protein